MRDTTPTPPEQPEDEDNVLGRLLMTGAGFLIIAVGGGAFAYHLAEGLDWPGWLRLVGAVWAGIMFAAVVLFTLVSSIPSSFDVLFGRLSDPDRPAAGGGGDDEVDIPPATVIDDGELGELVVSAVAIGAQAGITRALLVDKLTHRLIYPDPVQLDRVLAALAAERRIWADEDGRWHKAGDGKTSMAGFLAAKLARGSAVRAVDGTRAGDVAPGWFVDLTGDQAPRSWHGSGQPGPWPTERVRRRMERFGAGAGDTDLIPTVAAVPADEVPDPVRIAADVVATPGTLAMGEPGWLPAVRALSAALSEEIKPVDVRGGQSGRGAIELAATVGRGASELDEETVLAYVSDHMLTLFGRRPRPPAQPWSVVLDDVVYPSDSPRWASAVARLRRALDDEIHDADVRHCGLGGRGLGLLTAAVWDRVHGLSVPQVRDFVSDYLNISMGLAPSSVWAERWAAALDGIPVHEQYRDRPGCTWEKDTAPGQPAPFGVAEYPPRRGKPAEGDGGR